MLRSFIAWLDEYLQGQGSSAIVKSIIGMMSFAALLGAVFGDVAVKSAALVAVVFTVLALGLVLVADRRSLLRELNMQKAFVSDYCRLIDSVRPSYRIISWEQLVVINSAGDAKQFTTIRAAVEGEDFRFFRLRFSCGWQQPARFRRQVRLDVHSLLIGDVRGVGLERTISWPADGEMAVIAHMRHPPRPGSEINVVFELRWPGKCKPLMKNRVSDHFTFLFTTPVSYVQSKIVLPDWCEAYYQPIGFEEGDNGYVAEPAKDGEGRNLFVFEAYNLPVQHEAGIKLHVKKRAPR